jgi:hypothetical protein
MIFSPISDWYWQVTGVGLYGSNRGALVSSPTTDAAYLAWSASTAPTILPNAAELDENLAFFKLPASGLVPPTQAQLMAYANSKLMSVMAVPRTYALGGSVSVKADATTATGADLLSLNVWGTANPAATQPWVDDFGAVTIITGAEAVTLANAVLAYGQSAYAILASAMTGIAAGTITTTAQIDALAWPT